MLTAVDIAHGHNIYMMPAFRILALFSIAPVLGTQIVPMRVRLILALAVSVVVAPVVAPASVPAAASLAVVPVIAVQVIIGLAMGFMLRMVFAAMELGAQVIALQMGLGFAELIDPRGGVSRLS